MEGLTKWTADKPGGPPVASHAHSGIAHCGGDNDAIISEFAPNQDRSG